MKLTQKFGLDEKERSSRLAFLDFDEGDSQRLRSIHPLAKQHANELINLLYDHLLRFDQTRSFFSDPNVLDHVKEYQKRYFIQLTEGQTDEAYFENRLRVGDTHQRIELLPQWYLGLYSKYFGLIVEQITKHQGESRALEVIPSLMKLIFLDIGLAIDAYIQGGFIDKLRAERQVSAELREELARKEKLAILGQLAGGVGHELRNPMAAMSASIYFLRMSMQSDNPKIQKHLDRLEQELTSANEIITNLLDFSRVRQPELSNVSITGLIDDVLRHSRFDEITVTKKGADLEASIDSSQMRQVIGNLVTNAVQAMPDGGQLDIQTGERDGEVFVEIRDTGCGMNDEVMRKLFQPLFTTKAKGIGLGLAVCESLVRANGGRITVKSEPGKGSTFTVFLRRPEGSR